MSLRQTFRDINNEHRNAIENAISTQNGMAVMINVMNRKFDAIAEFLDEKEKKDE